MALNVWATANANRDRFPNRPWDAEDACVMCGQRTRDQLQVEVSLDGWRIPAGDPLSGSAESQGWWPIGPDCLRKLERA